LPWPHTGGQPRRKRTDEAAGPGRGASATRGRRSAAMSEVHTPPYVINIGPPLPSTHGVFRVKATLDGERIIDAEMVLGYLHRSIEKLAEERTFTQNSPFTNRMDYLAAMTGNLAY